MISNCNVCNHQHERGDNAACAHLFVAGRLKPAPPEPGQQQQQQQQPDETYGLLPQKFFGPHSDAEEANRLMKANPRIYHALKRKAKGLRLID